jgi:hypothetical protein
MSKRSEVEWQVAQEVAKRYEGKLAWCQATKQWLQDGKPIKLRGLHFMQDIVDVVEPRIQPGYNPTDYWARCNDLSGFMRVTANLKWLLHKDRAGQVSQAEFEKLQLENAALTEANIRLEIAKKAGTETLQRMQSKHAEVVAKLHDRIGEIELEHQLEKYGLQGKIERLRDGMQALIVSDPDDLF